MLKKLSIAAASATIATLTAVSGASAYTLFTDRASWEGAVSSFTTETFNSFTSDTTVTEATPFSGFSLTSNEGTLSSATFIPSIVDVLPFGSNPGAADIDGSPRLNIRGLRPERTIDLDFDSPIDAFGFDTVNYDVNNDILEVLVNGTDIAGLFPELRGQTGFIGVVGSGIEFARLKVQSGDNRTFNALDNVSIGVVTAVSTPEPVSLFALFGIGALGATSLKRKQKEEK